MPRTRMSDDERKLAQRIAKAKWREVNREKVKADERERRRLNPPIRDYAAESERKALKLVDLTHWPKYILPTIRHRAKTKGIDFDIDLSDIQVPKFCPVLGIELQSALTKSHLKDRYLTSPSVDRFDNDKGYVKGNVRVISRRANLLKSNATIEELEAVLLYMKGI